MFNPRFPHKLVVKRVRFANGQPVIDGDGNPIYDTVRLTLVEMYDEEPVRDLDGNFVTYEDDCVNYGYRTNSSNTQTMGDAMMTTFKIACPMFLTEIQAEDILELTDYDRTYRGRVIKKTTYNLGTNIWYNEIKN